MVMYPRFLLLPLKYGGWACIVVIFVLKVEDAFHSFEEVLTKKSKRQTVDRTAVQLYK